MGWQWTTCELQCLSLSDQNDQIVKCKMPLALSLSPCRRRRILTPFSLSLRLIHTDAHTFHLFLSLSLSLCPCALVSKREKERVCCSSFLSPKKSVSCPASITGRPFSSSSSSSETSFFSDVCHKAIKTSLWLLLTLDFQCSSVIPLVCLPPFFWTWNRISSSLLT